MSDDLIERLRKPAPPFGCEEYDPTYDVRHEAADALAAKDEQIIGLAQASLISDELHAAKDAALSEAAEKLEQTRVELGEALLVLGATEQNCATALSEMRAELERRKALSRGLANDAALVLEQAHARATAAEAQLERVKKALEPFAKLDIPTDPKWTCGTFMIEHEDIRAARALSQDEPADLGVRDNG